MALLNEAIEKKRLKQEEPEMKMKSQWQLSSSHFATVCGTLGFNQSLLLGLPPSLKISSHESSSPVLRNSCVSRDQASIHLSAVDSTERSAHAAGCQTPHLPSPPSSMICVPAKNCFCYQETGLWPFRVWFPTSSWGFLLGVPPLVSLYCGRQLRLEQRAYFKTCNWGGERKGWTRSGPRFLMASCPCQWPAAVVVDEGANKIIALVMWNELAGWR